MFIYYNYYNIIRIGFIKINCESRATFSWVSKYLFQSSNLWGFIVVGILQLKYVFTRLCNRAFSCFIPSLYPSLYLCSCSYGENHSPSGHPPRGRLPQSHLLRYRQPTVSVQEHVCFSLEIYLSGCVWEILMDVKARVKFCFYMCFKS